MLPPTPLTQIAGEGQDWSAVPSAKGRESCQALPSKTLHVVVVHDGRRPRVRVGRAPGHRHAIGADLRHRGGGRGVGRPRQGLDEGGRLRIGPHQVLNEVAVFVLHPVHGPHPHPVLGAGQEGLWLSRLILTCGAGVVGDSVARQSQARVAARRGVRFAPSALHQHLHVVVGDDARLAQPVRGLPGHVDALGRRLRVGQGRRVRRRGRPRPRAEVRPLRGRDVVGPVHPRNPRPAHHPHLVVQVGRQPGQHYRSGVGGVGVHPGPVGPGVGGLAVAGVDAPVDDVLGPVVGQPLPAHPRAVVGALRYARRVGRVGHRRDGGELRHLRPGAGPRRGVVGPDAVPRQHAYLVGPLRLEVHEAAGRAEAQGAAVAVAGHRVVVHAGPGPHVGGPAPVGPAAAHLLAGVDGVAVDGAAWALVARAPASARRPGCSTPPGRGGSRAGRGRSRSAW